MDYYTRLGVSKNASQDELKKAYKKLSMQHHPDRTGGDDTQFKQINEAYSTLKDPQKRAEYDNPQPQGFGPNGFQGMGGFEDLFSQFGFRQTQQRNQDVVLRYNLDFKEVFFGAAVSLQYNLPSGKKEFLDAAIPPGVSHGSNVRYAGLGDDSIPNLQRGNLILKLYIRSDPKWKRDGNNIYTVQHVNIFDLILGTTVEIVTPADRKFSLNVPTGTKPGTTFSITGHGVPDVNTRRPGNVHVKLDAVMPGLSNEALQEIRNVKDKYL
tara:strand:- start:276 stop:1076 length:801 start_codon:yes stop_codon:yes gene_type:complete